jgi:Prealbumin-like fold domain
MAAFGFRGRHTRRLWTSGLTLTTFALFAILFAGASNANLAGSNFEGNDGNLVVDTPGNTDWANVAGLAVGIDNPSGTGDNSFGQGSKEDDPNVSVGLGSIPPNKSDLTRFYEASETLSGQTFLYLAWERTNVLGSANMDFEINQAVTPGLGTPGPHTINRQRNDLLITYDFTQGGTGILIGVNFWLPTLQTGDTCFKANSAPCWGNHVDATSANSEAAVNTGSVTDPIPPNAPRTLAERTFGETALNLTGLGVFQPGVCRAFGSVFLKSRSSASFTAEIKDFVAPVPVNIANCGHVIIRKITDPNPDPSNSTFSYTTTGGLNPATFTLQCCSPNAAGVKDYGANVQVGSYTVTEDAPPSNFVFTSLNCSASDLSHGSTLSTSGPTVSFTLAADDIVDCTYTNTLQLGAIKVTKTSIKGNAPLAGAVFSVSGQPNLTTGVDGTACVDHLQFGSYTVTEVSAPGGFAIDDPAAHIVDVQTNAECPNASVGADLSFTDTPLTDITATAHSQAPAPGGTVSTIDCVDSSNAAVGNSPQSGGDAAVAATGLRPGTYVCTIVVDP